jgi:hypothetical protein
MTGSTREEGTTQGERWKSGRKAERPAPLASEGAESVEGGESGTGGEGARRPRPRREEASALGTAPRPPCSSSWPGGAAGWLAEEEAGGSSGFRRLDTAWV